MAQKKKIRGKGLISKLKTTKKKINQGLRSIGIKTQRKTYCSPKSINRKRNFKGKTRKTTSINSIDSFVNVFYYV